jgi:hypothetical protein
MVKGSSPLGALAPEAVRPSIVETHCAQAGETQGTPTASELIPQFAQQVVSRGTQKALVLNQIYGVWVGDIAGYDQNASHQIGANLENL